MGSYLVLLISFLQVETMGRGLGRVGDMGRLLEGASRVESSGRGVIRPHLGRKGADSGMGPKNVGIGLVKRMLVGGEVNKSNPRKCKSKNCIYIGDDPPLRPTKDRRIMRMGSDKLLLGKTDPKKKTPQKTTSPRDRTESEEI